MSTETTLRCPKCGTCGQVKTATIKGCRVCLRCGYLGETDEFKAMPVIHAQAPNRYVLNTKEGSTDSSLYRQLMIPREKADLLFYMIQMEVESRVAKGVTIIIASEILKQVVQWCESPEELVYAGLIYHAYVHHRGGDAISINQSN